VYFDPLYLLFALPGMLLGMWAQWRVKSTFSKWAEVPIGRGLTGAEIASRILDVHGIRDVRIEPVGGMLSDHYDPRSKTLRLSPDVFGGRSVSAAGVAAHEVGHAIQHAQAYRWLTLRSNLVPVLGITSKLAMPAIFIGFMLMSVGQAGLGQLAMFAGIALFSVMVLFQLVTLPVEFDASRRALAAIDTGKLVSGEEYTGARAVLTAAAWTYVAAAVASLSQLLYFLLRSGLLGGRRD
jgi:Zn-dependent membrane protease YugP